MGEAKLSRWYLKKEESGEYYAIGYVSGHARLKDNEKISTSRIIKISLISDDGMIIIKTKNTDYYCPMSDYDFSSGVGSQIIPDYKKFEKMYGNHNTINILLLGKTGVGKSSFLNYFVGEEMAKVSEGKPVTQELTRYEIKNDVYPLAIYDTKGLEADIAEEQKQSIIREIKKRNNGENVFNWFHTIFYLVSMSNARFEDFDADFIKSIRGEISQHVHIVLTNCDTANLEQIENMKRYIRKSLADIDNLNIFEVINVNMKKRNGKIVKQAGKEKIANSIFEMLRKDMAHKISEGFASELHVSVIETINEVFDGLMKIINSAISVNGLVNVIISDGNESVMDKKLDALSEKIEIITKCAEKKLNEKLKPISELYNAYSNIVYENAEHEITASHLIYAMDWIDDLCSYGSTVGKIDDSEFMNEVLPHATQMDLSSPGILDILNFVGDLFQIKKNINNFLNKMKVNMLCRIPSERRIKSEVEQMLLDYWN